MSSEAAVQNTSLGFSEIIFVYQIKNVSTILKWDAPLRNILNTQYLYME